METYLVDQAVLGDFVDTLISAKYPGRPAAAYVGLRNDAIRALDHQILKAILGRLTKEQGQELNKLLDANSTEDADPSVYEKFFEKYGINLEEVLSITLADFRDDFLKGGKNA